MLSIRFGVSEDTMEDIDIAFHRLYMDEWLEDPFVKEMIFGIHGIQIRLMKYYPLLKTYSTLYHGMI